MEVWTTWLPEGKDVTREHCRLLGNGVSERSHVVVFGFVLHVEFRD